MLSQHHFVCFSSNDLSETPKIMVFAAKNIISEASEVRTCTLQNDKISKNPQVPHFTKLKNFTGSAYNTHTTRPKSAPDRYQIPYLNLDARGRKTDCYICKSVASLAVVPVALPSFLIFKL